MRGVETRIQEIRHRIFREVARMAYHTEWPVDKRIEELPYKIIPGEVGNFRNDVFLERAIVGERLRLAMGLPCRNASEHAPVSDNIEAADRAETYYTPPLINVIKFACNACKEKRVHVTDGCQGCLAHPCVEVCPKELLPWIVLQDAPILTKINVSNVESAQLYVPTMLSSFSRDHVQQPAVWMLSLLMKTVRQTLTMISAYPADSAL